MISSIDRVVQLPPAARGALVLASGGGLIAAAGYFLSPKAMFVLAAGLVLVVLLMAGYRFLLKKLAKRKSKPMEAALSGNAGAAPQGISDPARRASLDSLRKSFEGGVEKFKAAGKNLYALPWYALVGESGSGKTEAIRHCNVGFPPGLQDQLQGVGGTINMNWWFTNHAVILDTAGRMMFEEVEPGSTNEWQEFLRLLKRNRPNCPINGMLLVIPAESLIKDTAEQLEHKGGKIAQQLDNIQRVLGVRFPVFVVITKCDLINGFREFFDTIKDPQLQHQIMGWSNPAELDEAFNPDLVEQHLRSVQQRLQRRRLGLLIDPVHTEDPAARRADQVDALFAFPDSLVKIAPRLRRYLEMIFVAGEWSAKPLFLRGIYFTSSMREGSALDADLAEALGRPVEALPEGRIWERDRAYFLRDLFMQKVFKEKGLVTRAGNTRQQQRQRRMVVSGAAAAGLAIVGLFTWLGWRSLEGSVVEPKEFWNEATGLYTGLSREAYARGRPDYYYPIIYPDDAGEGYRYRRQQGERDMLDAKMSRVAPEQRAPGRLPLALADRADQRIGVPWVFYPVALVSGDASGDLRREERHNAARAAVEASVLEPLLDVARERMKSDLRAGDWSPDAEGAYHQLVRVELAALERNRAPLPPQIDPLLRYALGGKATGSDYEEAAKGEVAGMQQAIDRLYGPDAAGSGWGARLAAGDHDLIRRGAVAYAKSWSGTGGTDALSTLGVMIGGLGAFADAEATLHALDSTPVTDAKKKIDEWTATVEALKVQVALIEPGLLVLGKKTLPEAHADELRKKREALEKGLLHDLARIAPGVGNKPPDVPAGSAKEDQDRWGALNEARQELTRLLDESPEQKAAREARLALLEGVHLGGAGLKPRMFQGRMAMYILADVQLNPAQKPEGVKIGTLRPAMTALDTGVKSGRADVEKQLDRVPETEKFAAQANNLRQEAIGVSRFALDLAGRYGRGRLIGAFLDGAGALDFSAAAAEYASQKGLVAARRGVPLTVTASEKSFNPTFHPEAAEALLGDASAISRALSSEAAEEGVLGAADLKARFKAVEMGADRYAEVYLRYWSEERNNGLRVEFPSWTDLRAALARYNQTSEFETGLESELTAIEGALRRVAPLIPPGFRIDPKKLLEDAALSRMTLESGPKKAEFAKVLASWRRLDTDPAAACEQLRTSVKAEKFDVDYVPARADGHDRLLGDLVARFWEDLALAGLTSVAAGAQKDAIEAWARIHADPRFPIVTPRADKPQLTAKEVAEAARGIDRIMVPEDGQAKAKLHIQRGEFDQQIDALFGSGVVSEADVAWFRKARAVLRGLPAAESEVLKCTVTVLTAKEKKAGDALAREHVFPYIGVAQGEGALKPQVYLRGGDAPLGSLEYPGGALRFGFFRSPEDTQPVATKQFDLPWGAVQLLHQERAGQALAERAAANRWLVELLVEDSATTPPRMLSVWLQVDFEKELPALKDWPK